MQGSATYNVWIVWKANRLARVPNAIWAGAGSPLDIGFSLTWLTAVQLA